MSVTLRNVNPLGQVDLPIAHRQGEPFGTEGVGCLEPGEVFDVSDEVAGREPSTSVDPETGEDVIDPGFGLLAQVGNYERVVAAPAKTKTSKGEGA